MRPSEDQDRPPSDVERQHLLGCILDQIPHRVFWKSRELRYLGCSQSFAAFVGKARPVEVIGLTDEHMPWGPELTERIRTVDRAVIESGDPRLHVVETRVSASGEEGWFDVSTVPLRDARGDVLGVLGALVEVTGERQRDVEQARAREHLELAVSAMAAGIVLYDSEDRFVLCNDVYRSIYPESAPRLLPGTPYREILEAYALQTLGLDPPAAERWATTHLEQHRACVGEYIQELPDRTIRINDRRTSDGGIVSLRTDISDLKRVERELRAAKDLAETANRSKSNFLASMSHEIRTPMTAILGFTDLLLQDVRDERQRAALTTIQRNGRALLSLMNDILDLSKIEAGMLETHAEELAPDDVLAEVRELLRATAEGKSIELRLDYPFAVPRTISSDRTRLKQILLNLVGNAIKFTDVGGVALRPQLERTAAGDALRIDVIDTGVGMTPEQCVRVFRPFEQAESSTTRDRGGTGLGLAISRSFAEALGGSLEVSSTPGAGSCFTLTLPVSAEHAADLVYPSAEAPSVAAPVAPDERRSRARSQPLQGRRVLLAEDGRDNQLLISQVLGRAGAEVEIVDNGEQAIEALERARAQGPGFDMVLMDMQMPVLDGYAATRLLRERGWSVPIIALTAHAMIGDREKCLAVGCSAYLSKPVQFGELLSTCTLSLRRAA
jgi:PAS domain S-box-containing protein